MSKLFSLKLRIIWYYEKWLEKKFHQRPHLYPKAYVDYTGREVVIRYKGIVQGVNELAGAYSKN